MRAQDKVYSLAQWDSVDTSLAPLEKTESCGVRVSLGGLRVEAGGVGQSAGWPDVKGRLEQKKRTFPP